MTTYGKKKRAIFPSFPVFQDEDQSSKPPSKRAGNVRYSSTSNDDIDELANSTLLDTLDQQSETTSTRNSSLRSGHSLQAPAKPLPPLPENTRSKKTVKEVAKRTVLGPKATNLKMAIKKTKLPTKPQISPPILISSSTDLFGAPAGPGRSFLADTPSLGQRVAALQQVAVIQEAETKEKEKRLAFIEASSKLSPFQRGKCVLTTAKRAIASRLGSSKIKLGRDKAPLNLTLSGPRYEAIRDTAGRISTAQRSLPIYESMRTRRETPEPEEEPDPFSDSVETNEAWSDLDLDSNRLNDGGSRVRQYSVSQAPLAKVEHSSASEISSVPSDRPSEFSNKLSGLRQHPNPQFFSSSPIGFSTPRVRLKPVHDTNGKKRLSTVLVRDSPMSDYSSERDNSDDEDGPLIRHRHDARNASSMKRKSATEDLRLQVSKRAKTDSATSGESAILTRNFGQLDTNDARAMQGIEQSEGDGVSGRNELKNNKFGIFDRSKGNMAEIETDGLIEDCSMRRHSRQTSSSLSRPTSVLFSRESRARIPLLKKYEDDEMEIDELQNGGP
ncbi:MAG: hypothetical protein Q9219_001974 [cf. Caloplaca sp. 3 TL-2023]